MDLSISSPKPGHSPSSDPEEKEISEDDDDDRNHKHRRRDACSQSLEGDASEQVFTRPFRKRNKPFENGHPYKEGGSQYSEPWKNHNIINQERDSFGRFEKRRQHVVSFGRTPFDLSQRIRLNQSLAADPGLTRGRGRESSSWNQRDARFSSLDIASLQPGAVPPSLFAGRGLPNVSNVSWNAFGLIPAIPNGGLETLHTISMQGALNSSINPPLSLGIPRARCRDFEERGFCLRGDMCPMEHGVHRIVVEDVQSLSQFNLPVSLPGAHMLGTTGGQGPLPANAPSGTLMNNKSLQNKTVKPGMSDDGLGLNDAFIGGSAAGGSDLYDPDQPLWANDSHDASSALLNSNSSNVDKIDPLLDQDSSEHLLPAQFDSSDNDRLISNAGAAAASQSSSVWGRIRGSKNRSEMREKVDFNLTSSSPLDNERRKDLESISGAEGIVHKGRPTNADESGSQVIGLPSKPQNDSGRNSRKPSQKALRTLFVSGVPQKDNKREALLAHFKKFGEVIDIYIPSNSERAFVQFSKREEAEAALKAPDAVMGNRFIKLWWANRDSIPEDGLSGVNSPNLRGSALTANPTYPLGTNRGKDNVHISGPKNNVARASSTTLPGLDHQMPVITNGAQATPPVQKKLESLELMKEELRKKQEMLDQKRSEFKRHLDKLQKQATGLKDELTSDQPSKRLKGGTLVDVAKIELSKSSNSGTVDSPRQAEATTDTGKSAENAVAHGLKSSSIITAPEPSTVKPLIRPLGPVGAPFVINRFKLDNRPTAFRILPPLPSGLANVSALKDYFSTYGDLSLVELEDIEPHDIDNKPETLKISARISFTNRRSAERAFLNGKCWQGENLHFMWLTSSNTIKDISGKENTWSNSSKDTSGKENSSASLKLSSDANIQSGEEVAIQVTAASGDGESETLQRRADDVKSDQVGDLQSS